MRNINIRFICFMIIFKLLIPKLGLAHVLKVGAHVPTIEISNGEILYQKGKINYCNWNTNNLNGKVHVILYLPGRLSAKKGSEELIEWIKDAHFPLNLYQTIIVINTNDSIPGTSMIVRAVVENNKKKFFWSQFVIDSKGKINKDWQLKKGNFAIILTDKNGVVCYINDIKLTKNEIQNIIKIIQKLLIGKDHL